MLILQFTLHITIYTSSELDSYCYYPFKALHCTSSNYINYLVVVYCQVIKHVFSGYYVYA